MAIPISSTPTNFRKKVKWKSKSPISSGEEAVWALCSPDVESTYRSEEALASVSGLKLCKCMASKLQSSIDPWPRSTSPQIIQIQMTPWPRQTSPPTV